MSAGRRMWKDSWFWFYVKEFVGCFCVWCMGLVFVAICLLLAAVLLVGFCL